MIENPKPLHRYERIREARSGSKADVCKLCGVPYGLGPHESEA